MMNIRLNRRSLLIGLGTLGASVYLQGNRTTPHPSSNRAEADFPPDIQRQLNKAVDQTIAKDKIPGAVIGVWIPGQGHWLAAKGTSDLSTQASMRLGNHFRIGSVTKTTTVNAILQLAERQQLSPTDPVGKYLPFVPNGDKITLKMLANMSFLLSVAETVSLHQTLDKIVSYFQMLQILALDNTVA